MENKMKVEIWSDIVCPFCYIGKRKFEAAMKDFPNRENITIEWKSYQLSPDMKTDPTKNIHQHLAEHKGISVDEAKSMNNYVSDMARQVGLTYNFDHTIPANTKKAHQFLHFAKNHGKQNEAGELLFNAYFIGGKNIDDINELLALSEQLSLNQEDLKRALEKNEFETAVEEDIYEAFQIGVKGVPFFVFNRKYAISGAQDKSVFAQTIETAFNEWKGENQSELKVLEGETCDINGHCN